MGKTFAQSRHTPGVYQDDPDRDDAASMSSAISMRENIFDDEDLDQNPPPYTDDTAVVSEGASGENETADEESWLRQPQGDLDREIEEWVDEDARGTKYTRLSPTLTTDPVALKAYIERMSSIRPQAYIHVRGDHTETQREGNNKKTVKKVDFSVKFDVTDTISRRAAEAGTYRANVPEWSKLQIVGNDRKTYRGGLFKSVDKRFRADVEETQVVPSLEEWCHLFCASSSKLKSFTIRRHIMNRNEAQLRTRIESIIRATNYRGHITITFPLSHRTLTVISQHPFNRLRHNKYVFWFCVIFQLWWITWPVLFLMTKRWAVVDSCWPYRRPKGDPYETVYNGQRVTKQDYECVKESENEWADRFSYTIQRGVLSKAVGGSVIAYAPSHGEREAELEAQRLARENEAQGGFVGGTLALLRGVSNIVREVEDGRGWGYDR